MSASPPQPGNRFVSFVRACVRAKLCARDSVSRVGTAERVSVPALPFSLLPFCGPSVAPDFVLPVPLVSCSPVLVKIFGPHFSSQTKVLRHRG